MGMAFTLWWPALVRHHSSYWLTPSDIWSAVRAAHFVQWGGLSYVYSYHSTLLTLPGFNVLLAPIVTLCSALGLSESSVTVYLPKPEAWLLVGPFCLAASGVGIFALDALTRRLGVGRTTRRYLTAAGVVALWPSIVMWGHPEDVLALGFAIYAMLALSNGRFTLAGWLLGAAIAMQLYVVLLVPIVLGVIGIRKGIALLARAAIFPGFLLVAVLVPDFHAALWVLTKQPGFPAILHPTPWVLLAPHINRFEVSSGPVHFVALVAAASIGFAARRRRGDWASIFWLAAIATGIRCLFEPVMVPYYVMPAVVLAFAAGATRSRIRGCLTLAAGLGLTVMAFSHSNMWTYWFEMAGLMTAMFLLARPPVPAMDRESSFQTRATFETRHEVAALVGSGGTP
jgi:uncharacterized membrane protein YozB (DUF420 family)